MGFGKRLAIWGGMAAAAIAAIVIAMLSRQWPQPEELSFVTGAVLADDADLHKQRPIGEARITATAGASSGEATSDGTGLFRLTLTPPVMPEQRIRLIVEHPEYHPFETIVSGSQLQLVRLDPNNKEEASKVTPPTVSIANVRVRYAVKTTTTVEIASAARTFEIVNKANVPCNDLRPCSPDGRWKATVGSFSLDAGENKQFRNARVSCLAGPCPFTRVETDAFSRGGRVIGVSVLNWADTVTYLVEAEVAQTMASELVRHSYPVIFGRSMNFTLPPAAQGPSIEAEVNGAPIVFPLGPKLRLSWASCRLETGVDRTRLYRCELKPEYLFKS